MNASSAINAHEMLDALELQRTGYILFREARISPTSQNRIDGLLLGSDGSKVAVEAKVTRQDYLKESPRKRAGWLEATHHFVYLTPKGLLRRVEVPADCGLWEYEAGNITEKVSPPLNASPGPLSDISFQSGRESRYERRGETPLRSFRIPDALWLLVKQKADSEGLSASEVVRAGLAEYVGDTDE